MPKWKSWDRSPSEPVFKDYTYLSYNGDKIHTFDDALDFQLTSFLNEADVSADDEEAKLKVIEAYKRFESESNRIYHNAAKKVEMLQKIDT